MYIYIYIYICNSIILPTPLHISSRFRPCLFLPVSGSSYPQDERALGDAKLSGGAKSGVVKISMLEYYTVTHIYVIYIYIHICVHIYIYIIYKTIYIYIYICICMQFLPLDCGAKARIEGVFFSQTPVYVPCEHVVWTFQGAF